MSKRSVLALLGYGVFVLFWLFQESAVAQNKPTSVAESLNARFELRNGDRVVFLGNSLFENDLQYGYLELALTTRWPERNVTYRNIGWTGDNVFGVARSTITNPPTAYELLMDHLTKAQPTIVFVAYGGIEAQEGEEGLPAFQEGLTKLLDKIDQLGAKAVLLSPIPILSAEADGNLAKRNAMLELYSSAIAKTAVARNKRFIDVFNPILERSKQSRLTENGIHLNQTGYYYLAGILEKGLGLEPRSKPVTITVTKTAAEAAAPAKVLDTRVNMTNLKFTIDERYLPLPPPMTESGETTLGQIVKITGLKKGFYRLTADNSEVVAASAKQWETGVFIQQGGSFEQAQELQQLIIKKNELFFFQYRPLNTTYILGMRAHEQGNHVKELEEQSIIIAWLEGQIALNRSPKTSVYQLTLLK